MTKLISLSIIMLFPTLLMAQAHADDGHRTAEQVCQLISANPPDFRAFQHVPKVAEDKRFKNRRPKVTFVVNEDGSVTKVRVVKGTGSPQVDAGLVKSIQAWKYKPQPGCVIETSMVITIDIK